ncbi:hypothetical protein [Plantactinospora sonchi]|uniref:Aminoglycoside phosphotransferase domain-containing protein n=1 Tax=Plantactinospora sonchi TaxID=1544735 RepID=A0ABU7S553_9ACTN
MTDEPVLTGDWDRFDVRQTEAFRSMAVGAGVCVNVERYHDGGFSGAPIALVTWRESGKDVRRGFLRFYGGDGEEIARIRRARDDAPADFRDRHLPEVQRVFLGHSWAAMVDVAGGDLLACPPLGELMAGRQAEFPRHLGEIVHSVVRDWNQPLLARPARPTTISGYLAELVDGRPVRRTEPRSRLREWARRRGVLAEQEQVRLDWSESALPNPLAYLAGSATRSGEEVQLLVGRTHGDLNIGNILVPVEPALVGEGYQLIDLGGYHDDGPLTRDPVHLLLSMAAQWIRTSTRLGDGIGAELIRALVHDPAGHTGYRQELVGHAQVCAAVHDAGRAVATNVKHGDEWRRQTLLSLAGCALLFADRDLRMEDEDTARDWFVCLAASALADYLRLTAVRSTPTPPVGRSQSSAVDVPQPADRPRRPSVTGGQVESATDSCKAIVHHIAQRIRDPRGLAAEQTHLLMLDFGARAPLLDEADHTRLAVRLVQAFSPAEETGDVGDTVDQPTTTPTGRSSETEETSPGSAVTTPAWSGATPAESGRRVDVAVLASHPEEYRALLRVFVGRTARDAEQTRPEWTTTVTAQRAGRQLSVHLVRAPERLEPRRAPAVRDVVERIDPPAFFLVGTAWGSRDGKLGDVLVPRFARHYELLEDGDLVTRVTPLWIPDHIHTLLSYYRRVDTRFQQLVSEFRKAVEPDGLPELTSDGRPRIIFDDAVACGSPDFATSVDLDALWRKDQRLAAFDTESYEFGVRNDRRLWAVFRGLVPKTGAEPDPSDARFLAAGHAAACLKDFLEHEYLPE